MLTKVRIVKAMVFSIVMYGHESWTIKRLSAKELMPSKCWEGLGAGGKGDDRGWDGWMASTRWTWVWVNSGRWWWTGRPGVLWFMGSQRIGHDWATELNWTELWCWIRLLRVPWTARRSNQSILKEVNPEYPLEGLMLTLQYSDYLMQRADSLGKTQMPGKKEGKRRSRWQRMRWDSITDSMAIIWANSRR